MTTQTDRPTSYLGVWALLFAVAACGGPLAAQSRQDSGRQDSGGRVTVYADINFGGQSSSFRDDTPNLVSAGWNDNISSIRIPNGESWEVCQDVDYRSQCQTLSGNVADLRSMGWNDRISSLRRIDDGGFQDRGRGRGRRPGWNGREASVGVTVYEDPNFTGQSASFRSDTPNLVRFNMNDKISSIRIPIGERWEICQDVDYGNQCQELSGSVSDLRRMGWNDRISSLRHLDGGGYRDRRSDGGFPNDSQQSLMFFNRPGYRGSSTVVTGGSSRMGFPAWEGSVQVRGGGSWELCDGTGGCATIDRDVSDVSNLGLNDRITSARVVNNSQYRRGRE